MAIRIPVLSLVPTFGPLLRGLSRSDWGSSLAALQLPLSGRTPSVIACGDATSLKREADVNVWVRDAAPQTYARTRDGVTDCHNQSADWFRNDGVGELCGATRR